MLGPAGGGALIEALSWRAIFWVNIPLIVVTVLLTLHSVEESSDPEADRAIDWVGIVLSAAGLGGPVFALIEQPTHGWGDPMVYVPLIGGVLLFAAFLLWESRYRHAMLDLSLFRIRNFWVTNLETLIVYAGLIGAFFFVTLFLQQTMGYTPLEAGLATTPTSVALFFLSPRFGRFSTAVGPRLPMALGPIVGGIGLLLLTRVDASSDYVTDVLPGIAALRPRALGDGGAADGDGAQLGRGAARRHRLGHQQRRLAGRRAAGDRDPRRGDRGQLQVDDRRRARRRER